LDLQQDLKAMQTPSVRREPISAAHAVIRPYIRRTPIIDIDLADFGRRPQPLTCKLEVLQHAGSFKPRGAFTNLLCRPVPPAGVVAASGGNHGLAVAFAARTLGITASIFVPGIAAATKRERIASLGAKLTVVGERYADALAASQHFAAESGALQVHAFDQHETLLGQGSIGLELEQQCPQLDTLLVAVGGGGLIAGIAAWFAGKVRIVGVEPRLAPTLYRALEAGRPVDAEAGGIAADSLAPKRVGELVFPLAKSFVERVVLVEDDAIRQAQRELWRVMRIVSEPGGAAAMAALLSAAYEPRQGERIAVLLCGANTDSVSL
jgi:threonine dehydratase